MGDGVALPRGSVANGNVTPLGGVLEVLHGGAVFVPNSDVGVGVGAPTCDAEVLLGGTIELG